MKRGVVPAPVMAPVAPISSVGSPVGAMGPISTAQTSTVVSESSWGPGLSITGQPLKPMLLNQDLSSFSTVPLNSGGIATTPGLYSNW